jgi:hypothetical protein
MVCPAAWLLAASLCVPVAAQAADAAALTEREHQLAARAVEGLHTVADAMQAQKQHHRAFELRRELLLEYSADDAKAREKCGFSQVGDHWRADPTLLVLDRDLTGDKKDLRKIDQQLETLGRELVTEHRALAEGWTRLSDLTRATLHWQRVLRWAPKDKAALAALQLATFEGFRGDALQMRMLRRARTIRGAVDWLLRAEFKVEVLTGGNHALLQATSVPHTGVRSEHFEIWGSLAGPQLVEIAQFAERALLLCDTLFGTCTGEPFRPVRHRDFVFVHTTAAYHQVLDHCAAQFDSGRLAFLKNDVEQAFVEQGGVLWRLYSAVKGRDVDLDQTVRAVVQDASGIDTDGLWEGLGHAACGFLFGRTLTFLLEQQTQRTSASSTSTVLSPDLATWRQIAEASAWARSDSRTSELVLLSAARFQNEQRVKAWAISDYLLHWRPELLLELDRCRSDAVRTPPEIEAEFLRRTGYDLTRIDREWREFWAKGQDLRAAMAKDPVGDEKAPEHAARVRARSLVDAVDEARRAVQRGPIGFYVATSPGAQEVRQYVDAKAKAEVRQKKKPKEVVPIPEPPAALGTTVFWSNGKTPEAAVAEWLLRPAARDVLLHPGRSLAGSALAADDWLLDVSEPAEPTRRGDPLSWPRAGQVGVPGAATVGQLGSRGAAALQAAGKQPTDTVGVPLSLHFFRAAKRATLDAVRCRVFVQNLAAEGVVVVYGGDEDPDGADGCVAFVPFAPLAPGAQVEVLWDLPAELLPPDTRFPAVTFTVQ